jgi:uncharacterized protein YbaR (Trm112 family)
MDKKLLDILVCPVCKGPLLYNKEQQELLCKADRLAYPIRDDIPVMLEDEARRMTLEEVGR